MQKIPRKPCFSQEAYADHFVIRGVKLVRTAHLGEIFEVPNAPFEYIQILKKIKAVKRIIVHKVDSSNLGVLSGLVRRYQKQLHHFIHYGPWLKRELDELKKLIQNKKTLQVNAKSEKDLRRLSGYKNIEEITFTLPPAIEMQDKISKNEHKSKGLRLNKLKRIVIEGHCDSPVFESLILRLEKSLKFLGSLQDIRFLSVVMQPDSQIKALIPKLQLFRYLKEIRIGSNDFSNSVIQFINHAEVLCRVEQVTAALAFQEMKDPSKLGDFKNLKHLDLLFSRELESSEDLNRIFRKLKFPKSIESITLNIIHLEVQNIEREEKGTLNCFDNLQNLKTLKLSATIDPAIDNNQITAMLKAAFQSKLKTLHVELNNSMFFVSSQDLVPFDFSLTVGIFSNISRLNLKLPLITFENFPIQKSQFLQIAELKLEGAFGIQHSENIDNFLNMINPTTVLRLELNELDFQNPDSIFVHLNTLKKLQNLQIVQLIYKNIETSPALYHSFREFVKTLWRLSYISVKIDQQSSRFEDFKQKLLNFVHTLPKMNLAQIDPYHLLEQSEN